MSNNRRHLIDPKILDQVLSGVSNGQYHLILGAGASIGCRNPLGLLPSTSELEAHLLDLIDMTGESVGLQRAYEAAVEERGSAEVISLLRSLFSESGYMPWHQQVAEVAWEAIWTFNIDDVMEKAYGDEKNRSQRAKSLLWRDPTEPYGGSLDVVPLVHLHGYIGADPARNPGLVFSLTEYLSVRDEATKRNWQTKFRADYGTMPAIIIGASIRNEVDFAEIVRSRNDSAAFGLPSLVVLKSMSDFEKAEFRRWGLEPIEADAGEFMTYLLESVKTASETGDARYSSRYTDRVLFSYASLESAPLPASRDFYGGDEPEPQDIRAQLDAVPPWLTELVAEVGDPTTTPAIQRLYVIHGGPFTGKSTSLLRLGFELRAKGWDPFYFGGQEQVVVEEILNFFDERPNAVLLLEDLHFDTVELTRLMERGRETGARVLVFGCERDRHMNHVRKSIPPRFAAGINSPLFAEPNQDFWWRVVQKRSQHIRLGRIELLKRDERGHRVPDSLYERRAKKYFIEHDSDLYSALASLEDAGGFIDRGLAVYEELPPPLRPAFLAIGLVASHGLPIPATVVAGTTSLQVHDILGHCGPDAILGQWVAPEPGGRGLLALRHRYIGDLLRKHVISNLPAQDRFDLLQGLCLSLSPAIDPNAIRRRTIEYRIVSALMDADSVQGLLGKALAETWYESMSDSYGWNARYWEQRALASESNLPHAFSYATRAVSILRDAFSLNTLGTILMRRANEHRASRDERVSYWREACAALHDSTVEGEGRFEHPFMTFFHYTLLLKDGPLAGDENWVVEARSKFEQFMADVLKAGMQEDRGLRALTGRFPKEW